MQIKHVLSFVQIHPLLCIEYRHTFPLFENCRVFLVYLGENYMVICDICHVPENVFSAVIPATSWYSSFFSFSNRRQCFISPLFWKFCDNSQIYKSDTCSRNCSLSVIQGKLPMERSYFSIWLSHLPSSIFCLNIYNQVPMEKHGLCAWERTKFKQICHLLDVCPWNKLV